MQHDTSGQSLDLIVGDLEMDIPAGDSAAVSTCHRIYCI